MSTLRRALHGSRLPIAGLGLLTLGSWLLLEHGRNDTGLAAEDVERTTLAQTRAYEAAAGGRWTTGALVLDLVEPGDGEGGSESELAELVDEIGLSGVEIDAAGFYSEGEHLYRIVGDPDDLLAVRAELETHALVEGIEPELIYSLPDSAIATVDAVAPSDVEPSKPGRFVPDDPKFKLQWHMEQIRAPEAWTVARGAGAVVAVIDTGVAYASEGIVKGVPDLAGTRMTDGETFVRGGVPRGLDDHAHGTHVAGTIAQTTNNGIGVTGVAHEATIMPLKVLSAEGRGSVPDIANAVRYAADHGAQVINMSLGGPLPSRVLAKAVEYAHDKGVTVVCAAGNEKRSRVGYPAANQGAVAISAVDFERNPTFYTNWGKDIDLAAPGGDVRVDKNGDGEPDGVLQNTIKIKNPAENDYLWFMGTSMASPHAAGVAALIVSQGVTNPDEVERILKDTAVHPGQLEWDERYGAGIVDARAAVGAATGDYGPERAGFAGLLALLGLAGSGASSLRGRARLLGPAGVVAGGALASGALGTTPLAYLAGVGSGLWLSAALPLVLAMLLLGVKPLRGMLAGISLGHAALLVHGAVVLPTLITGIPGGPMVDRLWLLVNAIVALWLARRISTR